MNLEAGSALARLRLRPHLSPDMAEVLSRDFCVTALILDSYTLLY